MQDHLSAIPHTPGCYLMRDSAWQILYIGKAKDLAKRVASYFHSKDLDSRIVQLLAEVRHIDYLPAESERDALVLERRLIRKYRPRYNVAWRDDKSYPFIKLTTNEVFPRMFLTRKVKRDGAKYFGPYPNVRGVRKLLQWLHKLFPLRQCRFEFDDKVLPKEEKVLSCIYLHMKQCPAPCLARIAVRDYRKIAERVELFLKGNHDALIARWNKEMDRASESMKYEEAAKLRDLIQSLERMRQNIRLRRIQEDDLELTLNRTRGLTDLKSALGLPKPPLRIEAIDISNIQGHQPVGSLVVFKDGKPSKDDYRRFKIKTVSGIDDFAMMAEVVRRRYGRLKEENIRLPDLIVIDGGKGQLSSAHGVLLKLGLERQPVVGLAKREEEVFFPEKSDPLVLPKDSPALHILQHIRDEAHRFAVAYHRLRRNKHLFADN